MYSCNEKRGAFVLDVFCETLVPNLHEVFEIYDSFSVMSGSLLRYVLLAALPDTISPTNYLDWVIR